FIHAARETFHLRSGFIDWTLVSTYAFQYRINHVLCVRAHDWHGYTLPAVYSGVIVKSSWPSPMVCAPLADAHARPVACIEVTELTMRCMVNVAHVGTVFWWPGPHSGVAVESGSLAKPMRTPMPTFVP